MKKERKREKTVESCIIIFITRIYIVLKDAYNYYYCYRAMVSCTASAYEESVPGAKLNHSLFKPYNFRIKQNYNYSYIQSDINNTNIDYILRLLLFL